MSESPVVVMEGLSFAYDGPIVLEEVSLTIRELEFVGVVGPNGGGKTTLLKLMLGLLQPTHGTVRVFGERPERVRRRIGYVPQGFQYDSRLPVTVTDVVLMGRLGRGSAFGPYRRADQADAAQALGTVGLQGLGSRPFADLSGGQRQRALIARALTTGPDMLMLDEPTASVDAAAEREIHALLEDLNRTMAIVLVTHDLGFVSKAVRSVLCVSRRVLRHPTAGLGEITADLLEQMYGSEVRLVRHDRSCQEEEGGWPSSGPH